MTLFLSLSENDHRNIINATVIENANRILTCFFLWPFLSQLLSMFPHRSSQNKINLTLLILVVKQ